MTTETTRAPRDRNAVTLVRTAAATLALGALATLLGAFVSGSAAAYGALIGTMIVIGVFGFGTFTVNAVARMMPAAALLFALLTYTLQVLAMGLAFAALSGSGQLDQNVSRGWLGGTVIVGTLGWMTVQVALSTSRRIPVYDLPMPSSPPAARAVVGSTPEGGER